MDFGLSDSTEIEEFLGLFEECSVVPREHSFTDISASVVAFLFRVKMISLSIGFFLFTDFVPECSRSSSI